MKIRFGIRFIKFILGSALTVAVLVSLGFHSASHFWDQSTVCSLSWLFCIHRNDCTSHLLQSNIKISLGNLQKDRGMYLLFTLRFHVRFQTRNKNLPMFALYFLIRDLVINFTWNIELEHRLGEEVWICQRFWQGSIWSQLCWDNSL